MKKRCQRYWFFGYLLCTYLFTKCSLQSIPVPIDLSYFLGRNLVKIVSISIETFVRADWYELAGVDEAVIDSIPLMSSYSSEPGNDLVDSALFDGSVKLFVGLLRLRVFW